MIGAIIGAGIGLAGSILGREQQNEDQREMMELQAKLNQQQAQYNQGLAKDISPSFGTFHFSYVTRSRLSSKGLQVCQPLSAEPENHFIGFQISFANCLLSATHWYQSDGDSWQVLPIQESSIAL